MKLRPLYDHVVVKRLESEEKSAGGIVLPGAAQEKPQMGRILATGLGHPQENGDFRALTVKIDDKVMFSKFAGTEMKIDGEEVLIMRESDILAIVDE